MSSNAAAAPKKWAREYETIYILRPTVDADEATKIANRIVDVVARLGGKITKVDNWGRRKLAYTIKKHTRGVFVYVKYAGYSDLVAEVERNLRLFDGVIRYMTIVLEGTVDLADVTVDPEETKFLPIEAGEDEPELDAAQRLGLVPMEGEDRRRAPVEDEFGGEGAEGEAPAGDEGDDN